MSNITIYGIKNCGSMKKTFQWFEEQNIPYDFHDYKKQNVNQNILEQAIEVHGWELVLNKKGTTWRKLSDDVKNKMDKENAIKTALENPSIIKRPLIVQRETITLGFDQDVFFKQFKTS